MVTNIYNPSGKKKVGRVGLDLWGTIIKKNPRFNEAREKLFELYFPNLTPNICSAIMDSIKNDFNNVIEDSGWQPTQEMMINTFQSRLGCYTKFVVKKFMEAYQGLCLLYPPILIDEETPEILRGIKEESHSLALVSNTMFFSGETLREVLKHHDILKYFDSLKFSDEECYSKPSENICTFNGEYSYFIGDNKKTDGVFAKKKNSKYIQVYGKTETTLKDAYAIIRERG